MASHSRSKPFALPVVSDEDAELSRLMIGGERQSRESCELVGSPSVDLGDDRDFMSSVDFATTGDPLRGQFERILEPLAERCTSATSEHIRHKGLIFFLKGPQYNDGAVFELGGSLNQWSVGEWTRLTIGALAH